MKLDYKDKNRLEQIKKFNHTKNMSHERMEDYLEVIFELIELKGYASLSAISEFLNVRPASVTKMLKRLQKYDYVEYEKYMGVALTQKGKKLASSIRQRHDLLMDFFKILEVEDKIATSDIEGIEHHLDNATIKQLEKLVNFLKSNPKAIREFRK